MASATSRKTTPRSLADAEEIAVLHTRVVNGKGGGPEKTILSSASFLRETRYRLTAAYLYPAGDEGFHTIQQRARSLNSPLIGIPERGALDPRSLVTLWKQCRRHKTRIWHAHDYKSNFFGLLLKPLFPRMKLVTTVHGWVVHTRKTPLYYRVDKWCLPRYHRVLCVSDDLYETCKSLGVRADRLELMPNAIDVEFFQRRQAPPATALRNELGTPRDRLVIGAMGRLMPEKSFELLIEAVASLLQRGKQVELWIAGAGPCRRELADEVARRELGDRVRLLGFVDDVRGFHESLDIFALSSQREGLPNVVLEAAAMSVPIVSTRVAGIPKMLRDGKHALLCDVGDLSALTSALESLISDTSQCSGLAAAARDLVEENHSFRKRMDRMAQIYDDLLTD